MPDGWMCGIEIIALVVILDEIRLIVGNYELQQSATRLASTIVVRPSPRSQKVENIATNIINEN